MKKNLFEGQIKKKWVLTAVLKVSNVLSKVMHSEDKVRSCSSTF